mmetsp:Transcript_44747/g.97787  ORF Transcript_44747/g.97787 Transcript_44747/m.97787 type:complete len:106 (+) Transcript_44747:954-1271(+)
MFCKIANNKVKSMLKATSEDFNLLEDQVMLLEGRIQSQDLKLETILVEKQAKLEEERGFHANHTSSCAELQKTLANLDAEIAEMQKDIDFLKQDHRKSIEDYNSN